MRFQPATTPTRSQGGAVKDTPRGRSSNFKGLPSLCPAGCSVLRLSARTVLVVSSDSDWQRGSEKHEVPDLDSPDSTSGQLEGVRALPLQVGGVCASGSDGPSSLEAVLVGCRSSLAAYEYVGHRPASAPVPRGFEGPVKVPGRVTGTGTAAALWQCHLFLRKTSSSLVRYSGHSLCLMLDSYLGMGDGGWAIRGTASVHEHWAHVILDNTGSEGCNTAGHCHGGTAVTCSLR